MANNLTYPTYLDVPMMLDFLGTLEDGVSHSSESIEKTNQSRSGSSEGSLSGSTSSLVDILGLSLSLSGKLKKDKSKDESVENSFVRTHTSASLFNKLRRTLSSEGAITQVEANSDLNSVSPGEVVEFSGKVSPNPLASLIDFFDNVKPFIDLHLSGGFDEIEGTESQYDDSDKNNIQLVSSFIELLRGDIEKSNVVDLLMANNQGVKAIFATDEEYFTSNKESMFLGGTFTLLGKVTQVENNTNQSMNTVRRGAMGVIAHHFLEDLFGKLAENLEIHGMRQQVPSVQVYSPWIQVVPLAIYV
ncbi:DUF6414 family protein [Actinopolyspora alba]|nr:hypothetical protein [Actinopolyspora alba]